MPRNSKSEYERYLIRIPLSVEPNIYQIVCLSAHGDMQLDIAAVTISITDSEFYSSYSNVICKSSWVIMQYISAG